MKKASTKHSGSIHFATMTLTVSEELNKLKGRNLAPEKFAEANEHIMKLKLPKIND